MFIRVDLPDPDWPMMDTKSPRATCRSIPCSTRVSTLPLT